MKSIVPIIWSTRLLKQCQDFLSLRQSSSKLNHKIVLRKSQFCHLPEVTNFLIINIKALQSYCHGDAATRKTGQGSFRNGKYDHHLQFRRKYLLFRPKHTSRYTGIKKQAGHTSLMTRLGQRCDDITYLTAVAQVCAWIMRLPQVFAHFWRRRLFVQLY